MVVTINGKIEYELENSDINEVEVDYDRALEEINNALYATINDEDYTNYIKEDLKTNDIILNDIKELYVDSDCVYCELDIQNENLTDEEIIKIFKPIIEEMLSNSDTSTYVECSGEVTRDSWNDYKDEYSEETSYETWDDTLSLKYNISNCKVKREENK